MLKLLKGLKPVEWIYLLISVAFIVLQVWLDLKMPEYMGEITSLVQTPGSAMSEILRAGGMMLLLTLASVLASVVVVAFISRIAANFSARLRLSLFDKVQGFTMAEMNQFSIASLITRSTNDVNQIQMFMVMGLQVIIKSPILAVWAIVKIINQGWQWSLAVAIAVAVLALIAVIFFALVVPKFKRLQKEVDELNRTSRENLTGLRVVRAYNAESFQTEKFEKTNNQLAKTNLFTNRMMSVLMPSIDILINGLMLSIYVIGAYLISGAGALEKVEIFSNMMVFIMYAMQLLMAFMMMVMVFLYLPRAAVSAKRIYEVLKTETLMKEGVLQEAKMQDIQGEIEFKNVGFQYPDAQDYVLKGISFTAKKGETVAFIGSTGSGKSTLINLIPRFYDATEGEILIDGTNIKDFSYGALRSKLGYVSQKAKLFAGTVASNVSFGKTQEGKPQEAAIVKAIDISQSKEFVDGLEDGIDGYIAPGGTNLSGGQKQRISIARAVAREAEFLIFDDSFSALDYKTDRALRSALKEKASSVTVLVVAQRIGTIKHADKIIVLESGNMVGMGTHDELMKNCEVYQEIAYSQLNKEELS